MSTTRALAAITLALALVAVILIATGHPVGTLLLGVAALTGIAWAVVAMLAKRR